MSLPAMNLSVDELRKTHQRHYNYDYGAEQAQALLPGQKGFVLVNFPMEDDRDDEADDRVDCGASQGDGITDLVDQNR